MDCVMVSHTHWDREWYRTFQAFRARLVDTIDRVLELLDQDGGWRFALDGQAVVLEDYLEIRPDRRGDLEAACRTGRVGIGPWYVQPDSLLPSGESHVRNLLAGRRVASAFGPVSRVAYTPDSFGHPAQFPQLFAGFGLDGFVYWRGNGNEIDQLPATYRWIGADGTSIRAHHLGAGYFGAAFLPTDIDEAVARLTRVGNGLAKAGGERILLMNGVDHAPPDPHTALVAAALAEATGWTVRRGLFDDFVDGLEAGPGEHRGELVGGRVANLLPGVWSSRMHLKLADRATEAALVGWAEPWAAFGRALGLPDEQPALRVAWRELLVNQAHDSIGGCSADAVHLQMEPRYANAIELARETTARLLERIAGLPTDRRMPWTDEIDLAVFNPSPFPRTDVVRFPLDGVPTFLVTDDNADIHPLAVASLMRQGFTVDGRPARVVPSEDTSRFRLLPEIDPWDLEFVVDEIPAFGWRRVHLAPAGAAPDVVDEGPTITVGDATVGANDDGTLSVQLGAHRWEHLVGVEDLADCGDTYDFDGLPDDAPITLASRVDVVRRRAPTGVAELVVTRTFDLPMELAADRRSRADATVACSLVTTARLSPGVDRVDLTVRFDNGVRDHRLRILFPTGAPVVKFRAATTFDTARRTTEPPDDHGWQHRAPTTFPQQGWVSAHGLTVAAPGLTEAEVTPSGTIAVTLLRAVGNLARMDLRSRPVPAGPGLATPRAQCPGPLTAQFSLFAGETDPAVVRSTELGLRAVPTGEHPLVPPGTPLFGLDGPVVLSALKPAEDGNGYIVRILNPADTPSRATLRFGLPVTDVSDANLDETATDDSSLPVADGAVTLTVEPHRLRTIRVLAR